MYKTPEISRELQLQKTFYSIIKDLESLKLEAILECIDMEYKIKRFKNIVERTNRQINKMGKSIIKNSCAN